VALRRVSAYRAMEVWDGNGDGRVRFDAASIGEPDLGHIIEISALEAALLAALQPHRHVQLRRGCKVTALRLPVLLAEHETGTAAELTLDDGQLLHAALVIAADGAQSSLRELAGITLTSRAYDHDALVATIACEQPHQSTAWQRFTDSGPLALLPLEDAHRVSIVWSAPPAEIDALMTLTDAAFSRALTTASEGTLGALQLLGTRQRTPLIARHADHYVAPRLALIGDAAHTIHPLAGQGLNLGLQDVAALADIVGKAHARQLDIGDLRLLKRYSRARRSGNTLMLASMRAFRELFARHDLPVVLARNFGLSQVNRHTLIKGAIMRAALGLAP
jgi:2-octaprenylphenol hydroxylase